MASAVRMPQLGESVTEGTVVRWLKQPGDHVAQDESLAEIETEKVNVEIPSPFEGTLTALLVLEGETVEVGVAIATIEDRAGAAAEEQPPHSVPASAATAADRSEPPTVGAAISPPPPERKPAPAFAATGPLGPASAAHGMFSTGDQSAAPAATPAGTISAERLPEQPPPSISADTGRSSVTVDASRSGRYSPAVLRMAAEHQVDLSAITGTGLGGRISRKDVQAWIDGAATRAAPDIKAAATTESTPSIPPVASEQSPIVQELQHSYEAPVTSPGASPVPLEERAPGPMARPTEATTSQLQAPQLSEDEELEPLTAVRRAIATHMTRSVQTAPHAWMMIEVDLTRLVALRERVKHEFRDREGVELSYLPFMVKTTVAALKQHPRLNSSWSDQGVILKRRINIGIAVDAPQGLVVPVIRDADNLSIAGLARAINELAGRARTKRLRIEDVQGGTFTVDNVGPIGSIVSQPIINQPQCAIVTMESIIKRPVVIADAIAIRSMMNCCISFDHRIVDGGDIGPFMKTLKHTLEAMGEETPLY